MVEDVADAQDPTKIVLKAGQQVDGFAQLRDDGKTACGCWIYSGCYTNAGNQMARRDTADPAHAGLTPRLGVGLAGQPPHSLQPRILRHAGPALQPEARVDRVERRPVERHRHPGLPGDVPALGGSRAVHHERGGRFAVLCPRYDEGRRATGVGEGGRDRRVRRLGRQTDAEEPAQVVGQVRGGEHGRVQEAER